MAREKDELITDKEDIFSKLNFKLSALEQQGPVRAELLKELKSDIEEVGRKLGKPLNFELIDTDIDEQIKEIRKYLEKHARQPGESPEIELPETPEEMLPREYEKPRELIVKAKPIQFFIFTLIVSILSGFILSGVIMFLSVKSMDPKLNIKFTKKEKGLLDYLENHTIKAELDDRIISKKGVVPFLFKVKVALKAGIDAKDKGVDFKEELKKYKLGIDIDMLPDTIEGFKNLGPRIIQREDFLSVIKRNPKIVVKAYLWFALGFGFVWMMVIVYLIFTAKRKAVKKI